MRPMPSARRPAAARTGPDRALMSAIPLHRGAMRPILVALALGLNLTTAFAADQPILGRRLVVKSPSRPEKRRVTTDALEWPSPNSVVGDPTVAGATLTIRLDGDNPTEQTFPLPQGTDL